MPSPPLLGGGPGGENYYRHELQKEYPYNRRRRLHRLPRHHPIRKQIPKLQNNQPRQTNLRRQPSQSEGGRRGTQLSIRESRYLRLRIDVGNL